MTLVVGVALSAREWRGALQRHCRDHVADLVVTLLHDGREAIDGRVDLVVADDDTSWLSASFVTRTRELGVSVIALFDPEEADGFGRQHLERLGISCAVPATVEIEELVDLIRDHRPDRATAQAFAQVTTALSGRRPAGDRSIVAVGGPAGAGATEVAIGLAQLQADCAPSGRAGRVVLVDVDEMHPSLARRLALGLHPHLLTAVDAVRREESSIGGPADRPPTPRLVESCLATRSSGATGAGGQGGAGGHGRGGDRLPFEVLVGLASRDDWNLVRPDDVGAVVTELSARFSIVIVRLGPCLEDLSRHVERYETSRVVAGQASRVVGVCDGSATGLLRFLDWLVDIVGVIGDARLDVVVNRPPPWAGAGRQLVDRLRDLAGDRIDSVVCVPTDRRVVRAAWDGSAIAKGPFLRALRPLVDPGPRTSNG